MYSRIFKKSWREIFEHPGLFLPDVCGLLLTLGLGILALYFSGLLGLVLNFELAAEEKIARLIAYFLEDSGNLVRFFASVGFFVFTTFFLGAGFQVVKYAMFKEVAAKKKPGFFRALVPANRAYYWKFIGMKIAVFLLLAVGFLPALLVGVPVGIASRGAGVALFGLAFLVIFVYLLIGLFFAYPALFVENKGVRDGLRKSLAVGKEHRRKTLATGLIAAGIIFGAQLVIRVALIPVGNFPALEFVLNSVLSLIPGVWMSYFIFLMYGELRDAKAAMKKRS